MKFFKKLLLSLAALTATTASASSHMFYDSLLIPGENDPAYKKALYNATGTGALVEIFGGYWGIDNQAPGYSTTNYLALLFAQADQRLIKNEVNGGTWFNFAVAGSWGLDHDSASKVAFYDGGLGICTGQHTDSVGPAGLYIMNATVRQYFNNKRTALSVGGIWMSMYFDRINHARFANDAFEKSPVLPMYYGTPGAVLQHEIDQSNFVTAAFIGTGLGLGDNFLNWNNTNNGNPVIHVSAYAIQTDGFDNVKDAYDAYNEQWTTTSGVNNGLEWAEPIPDNATIVKNADELVAALNNAEADDVIALNNDIVMDADSTITIPAGTSATLNLNGKTLSGTADGTGSNQEMMLVKGDLTVTNGNIVMDATVNQGWDNMSTIFDVTAGGVLNLDGVTAVNEGGTDMNFVVHLNNWGEVTLNVTDSTLKAGYVAVRVFNSGYDMNNVTIKNTVLDAPRCFWVHNYTEADFEGDAAKADAQKALLNLNIYGTGNTFSYDSAEYSGPVRLGMNNSIYCDANGNVIQ